MATLDVERRVEINTTNSSFLHIIIGLGLITVLHIGTKWDLTVKMIVNMYHVENNIRTVILGIPPLVGNIW